MPGEFAILIYGNINGIQPVNQLYSQDSPFLVSHSFINQISNCKIQPGFRSDHSLISMVLDLNKIECGKGYFKINKRRKEIKSMKCQKLIKMQTLTHFGYIIRSKAEYIEGGEKNTKYFANLEKKRLEAKTLHKLVTDRNKITNQKEILNEVRSFYETMYTDQAVDEEKMKQMSNNVTLKLNEEDRISIEGRITEYEYT